MIVVSGFTTILKVLGILTQELTVAVTAYAPDIDGSEFGLIIEAPVALNPRGPDQVYVAIGSGFRIERIKGSP